MFQRYWGKPCILKRVKAYASGVNYLLQFLNASFNSPIVGKQESKVDVPVFLPLFCLCYVTISDLVAKLIPRLHRTSEESCGNGECGVCLPHSGGLCSHAEQSRGSLRRTYLLQVHEVNLFLTYFYNYCNHGAKIGNISEICKF